MEILVIILSINHQFICLYSPIGVQTKDGALVSLKYFDQTFLVDGLALMSKFVKEGKVFIHFQVQQLNGSQKVSRLEVWKECTHNRVFVMGVYIIDSYQILKDLVACW